MSSGNGTRPKRALTGTYTYIPNDHLEDIRLDTMEEFALATYLWLVSDFIGLAPWRIDRVLSGVRATHRRGGKAAVFAALESLEEKKRCIIYPIVPIVAPGQDPAAAANRLETGHVWCEWVLYHRLYQGNCSVDQLRGVGRILQKHLKSELLGESFVQYVIDHYRDVYGITIPVELGVFNARSK